ncbi:MAG: leucine-rich repeat protein [Acholeplasmataceae bacterium]|nr:leucine-rich repeat protein [Acholeplasmataceae bacterium]
MDKIRVLQIGGNTQKNGVTTYLLNTYKMLFNEFEFIFINTAFRESNEEVRKEIEKYQGRIIHLPYFGDFNDIEEDYRRVLRDIKPDVVHTHYFLSNGDFLRVAHEEFIPLRISHVHNNKSGYLSVSNQEKLMNQRKLIEKHATLKLAVSKDSGYFLYGDNDYTISKMVMNIESFYEIHDKEELYQKYNLDSNIKYSIFIGRFAFQKNVFFFIELLKRFKDRVLIMVGEGKEKENFIAKLEEENLSGKVIFMDDSNLVEKYNLADTYLLPSLYEGSSITLIEAQLCGLRCIASNKQCDSSNLGNVKYISLDIDLWMNEIEIKRKIINDIDKSLINPDHIAETYRKIYSNDNLISDLYVEIARRFKLGCRGNYSNQTKVYEYYKRAHELGSIKGSFYYSLLYFEGSGVKKDVDYAFEIVEKIYDEIVDRANSGDQDYLTILGDIFSFGIYRDRDLPKASNLYNEAVKLGQTEAMCSLAYMYEVGSGVHKDEKKAYELYLKSAEYGYLHSMRDVGLCYLNGIGIKRDYRQALLWLNKASNENYAHATADLAKMYLNGLGVYKNEQKAIQYLQLSILQDKSRGIRDLIKLNIDINGIKNNKIIYLNRKSLDSPEDLDENVIVDNTVVINKDIIKIKPNIFYQHKEINKFFVENDNLRYAAYNGVLYSKDLKILIRFPIASTIKNYKVPDHVEIIGNSAFDDCSNLISVDLNQVQIIEDWAFHGCDSLTKVFIPSYVREVGVYAFGSCESLEEIIVDSNNDFFSSYQEALYSKEFKTLIQYPIAKKDKIFNSHVKCEKIAFRALSDAINLEYIHLTSVKQIEEKAFYYSENLSKIEIYSDEIEKNKNMFDHTLVSDFSYVNPIKKLHLFADVHGVLRYDIIKNYVEINTLDKSDTIVVLGDFGLVWEEPMNNELLVFYNSLPCEVLFIDGNHENFDFLKKFPTEYKLGSSVAKISSNVFHLLRGNIYVIGEKIIFTFGGAYSIKRDTESSPVYVWKEELPSKNEYNNALSNLKKYNFKVDYVFTHQGPRFILDNINYRYSKNEHVLLDFLSKLADKTCFDKWFFGHIHQDIDINRYKSIYNGHEVIKVD